MPLGPRRNPAKFKILLAAVILLTVGAVAGIFAVYRFKLQRSDIFIEAGKKTAEVTMGKVTQTATRNGKVQWRLEAETVEYRVSKNRALFKTLSVVFYLDDDSEARLSADEGEVDTDTKDMTVQGNVRLAKGPYRLLSDRMLYANDVRKVTSPSTVTIRSDTGSLRADSMVFDLNTNRAVLTGRVEGNFDGLNGL